ncbi:MAG: hypothetical protein IJK26_09155 [Clostridia bacterium]|nr:hypothetical protein [Clostridia bacterium]
MNCKRIFSIFLAALCIAFICPLKAFADDEIEISEPKWGEHTAAYTKFWADCDECNWVRSGGKNRLDGIQAESREETEYLEQYIQSIGYVLANTDDKQITDEELKWLQTMSFIGSNYLNPENHWRYASGNFRTYVYRPTLDTIMKQVKEKGIPDYHSNTEMALSAVFIDYELWNVIDRVGTVIDPIDEINENLPENCAEDAGYVQFITPIDCQITLHLLDNDYYYTFFLRKGITLMLLRSDHYTITEINTTAIKEGADELIWNGNYIVVYRQPEDNPIVVNLVQVVARDGIEDIDVTGKPNYGYVYEPVDVKDLGDVIVERTPEVPEEHEGKKKDYSWIFLVLLVGTVLGIGYYAWKKRE